MTIALQWRVNNATLDGTTSFEWPAEFPRGEGDSVDLPQGGTITLTNGVYVIDLEDGVDLGEIDLENIPALGDSHEGYWVVASHCQVPSGCERVRGLISWLPGAASGAEPLLFPQFSAIVEQGPSYHSLRGVKNESWIPRGGRVDILAEEIGVGPFTGDYTLYLELGLSDGQKYRSGIDRIVREARTRIAGPRFVLNGSSASVARSFMVTEPGLLSYALFSADAALDAAESYVVQLRRRSVDEASAEIGSRTFDDANYPVANDLASVNPNRSRILFFRPGDQIFVNVIYTAGGSPASDNFQIALGFQPIETFYIQGLNPQSFF